MKAALFEVCQEIEKEEKMEDPSSRDMLVRLSNADAVAGREREVRSLLEAELDGHYDRLEHDGLGSALFMSAGTEPDPVRVMFAAHMDEVGFMVRHISDIGMLHLTVLGGVLDASKRMQEVRVTCADGNKVPGILNAKVAADGTVEDVYVDLGCETREEVESLGVGIGDMVTFASRAMRLTGDRVAGKAMDDRSGLYVLAEALKRLHVQEHAAEIWMAATSSEEVGTRGGKTAAALVQPDIFVAVDVASGPDLSRDFTNHRKLGKGCMVIHYDKTMVPHEGLLCHVRSLAREYDIPIQLDMLGGGGTDAGTAHLEESGRAALVIGIPLRGCHGAWSQVSRSDIQSAIDLVCAIAKSFDRKQYRSVIEF